MINTATTTTPESPSIGTVARKRRRQIIQQSRNNKATIGSQDLNGPIDDSTAPPKKARVDPITHSQSLRKVSDASPAPSFALKAKTAPTTATKPKKTQMRYDPDVPMTKEEAAAWRKEQRRKRNRESAAASRQRQRDRITELESEVSEWKAKYEAALARIERLEQLRESNVPLHAEPVSSSSTMTTAGGEYDCCALDSAAVSPCPSPKILPNTSMNSSASCCSQELSSPRDVMSLTEVGQRYREETGRPTACQGINGPSYHVTHLSEKISRPAVKITGATHDSLVPLNPTADEGILVPDPCRSSLSSSPLTKVMSSSHPDNVEPTPLSPVSQDDDVELFANELEFDEFLLDAAEWL